MHKIKSDNTSKNQMQTKSNYLYTFNILQQQKP